MSDEVARRDGVGATKAIVEAVLEDLAALHRVKRSPRGAYYVPGHTAHIAVPAVHSHIQAPRGWPPVPLGAPIQVGDSQIQPGQTLSDTDLPRVFGCSARGGMRRSLATNTLLLISHFSGAQNKQPYRDEWQGGVLHYTGMGLTGDQDLKAAQNSTLGESNRNGVICLLFESPGPKQYVFIGRVTLAGRPYESQQPDATGMMRRVWMFPLQVVS